MAPDAALQELTRAGHDFDHCVRAGLANQVLAFFAARAWPATADDGTAPALGAELRAA